MRFVIHALDTPGSLELRQATRPAHLEYLADVDVDVVVGGPLVDDNGDMCGSCLIVDAADRAAVQAFVDGDPYRAAGLFATVSIHEFTTIAWPT